MSTKSATTTRTKTNKSNAIKYERSRVGGVLKESGDLVASMAVTFKTSPFTEEAPTRILHAELDWIISDCFVSGTHFSDRRLRQAASSRPSAEEIASLPLINGNHWQQWLMKRCEERIHNKKVRLGAKKLYRCIIARLQTPVSGTAPSSGVAFVLK